MIIESIELTYIIEFDEIFSKWYGDAKRRADYLDSIKPTGIENNNQDYKVSKQEKDFLDDFAVPAGSGTSQPITFDNNMNAAGIMDNINEMYSDFALSF